MCELSWSVVEGECSLEFWVATSREPSRLSGRNAVSEVVRVASRRATTTRFARSRHVISAADLRLGGPHLPVK